MDDELECPQCGGSEFTQYTCDDDDFINYSCNICGLWYMASEDTWLVGCESCDDREYSEEYTVDNEDMTW